MGKQFYICWEDKQEMELYRYVQEECSMKILPMKKTKDGELHFFKPFMYLFIQEEEVRFFHYKAVRDERGELCKVLYPYNRKGDYLPCIEYS